MDELLPFGFGPSNVAGNQGRRGLNTEDVKMPGERIYKNKWYCCMQFCIKYCKGFVIGNRLHLSSLPAILEPVNVQVCAFRKQNAELNSK